MKPGLKRSFICAPFCCGAVAQAKLPPADIQKLPPPAAHKVDFATEIKPILEASCTKCHGRGKDKGGFSLDTRDTFLKGGDTGPAALIGKSAESYVIELVSGLNPESVMPQKGSKLKPEQIGLLRAWIDQGMPWAAGVTFARPAPINLKPHEPTVPSARKDLANPIDRILESYFKANKIKASRPVDDRMFARRVYLDVIGMLPTPEELEAFLADKRADKREQLVKHLLADNQRYAEHWLTFWNDMLRNDYKGTGYIDGGRKQISGWLFSALYNNVPYDKFVAQLINPTPDSEGFVKGIVWRGVVNASMTPPMQAAQNISQVFMGVNLKCASCHDSFINDWSLADSYGLASVFEDSPLELVHCDKPTGKVAAVKFLYPELGDVDAKAERPVRQAQLAQAIISKKDGRLSRTLVNRLWARFMGRGLVEPVDDMDQKAWDQDLIDWLAEDMVAHGYDVRQTVERILTSRAYQMPAVTGTEQVDRSYVFRGPFVRRMTAEQFRDAIGSLTGTWNTLPAGDFDFTGGNPQAIAADLSAQAKWIWNDANAASEGKTGTIHLRKTINLSETPVEAVAAVACDNSFTLYVNGNRVGTGKDYTKPTIVDMRGQLKKGENVIAVAAVNTAGEAKGPN